MPDWTRITIGESYDKPEPLKTVWIAIQWGGQHNVPFFYSWILGYIDEDGDWSDTQEDMYLTDGQLYAWYPCTIPAPPVGEEWGA